MSEKFTKRNLASYRFTVRPLSKAEGGGFLEEYPDIPGCMSDGATIEEAIANGREVLGDCAAVFQETGRALRKPSASGRRAGKH
jgi:antitoxin HicB